MHKRERPARYMSIFHSSCIRFINSNLLFRTRSKKYKHM